MLGTLNFTKTAIRNLLTPDKGRVTYRDEKEKGLSLYITANGVITFFVRRRVHGKDERIILGNFPDVSVENARKQALQVKAQISLGKNPNEDKKRLRLDLTFGEMFHEFLERYSKKHKKSWQYDEREVTRLAKPLFNRKASQLTRKDWLALHERIGSENGIYSANRVLAICRAVYNKAIEWGWEGNNPTLGIKKFKEKSRERFVKKHEIPSFFEALAAEENEIFRDFFFVALLTGARRSNVLAMQWREIDFAGNEWNIPETKNGLAHTVPLSPSVIEVLSKRYNERTSTFVFPGTGKTGHIVEPKRAWKRLLIRADIEDLRLHDLRRTLGSWMAANGATTAIIGKTLAHKSVQATKVYERLDLDPVRDSMAAAEKAMFAASNTK